MTEYANYIITAIGLLGFFLAGKKIWWAWYVNIANQALWFSYGWATEQWGFVVGTIPYTIVFTKNAYSWTKEHRGNKLGYVPPKPGEKIGEIEKIEMVENGLLVTGRVYPPHGAMFTQGAIRGFSIDPENKPPLKFGTEEK